MTSPVRVAITGAAGQIGYSLLFRVASGSMLGPDQPVILHLKEITPAMDATLFTPPPPRVTSRTESYFKLFHRGDAVEDVMHQTGAKRSTVMEYLTDFVRAEIDKDTAYKGEQVIVSYYIYRKAQVSAMNVDKFSVPIASVRRRTGSPTERQ